MNFVLVAKYINLEFRNAFGSNLRSLRLEKGLSQEELAFRCDVALSQIGRFERGERSPTLDSFYQLASGLNIEPKELLNFSYPVQ